MISENPEAAGFGVYVHWPFCASKCPYCDFNSHVRHGGVDQAEFSEGFVREIRHVGGLTGPRTVDSIFFGGGTPSLMEPRIIELIMNAIGRVWTVSDDTEITLEANPSSVEASRFSAYRGVGINRVSLGVQALNDADLRKLGRLHTAREAFDALAIAQRTFERSSFDLIYARPGQTVDSWRAELSEALALAAGHLSVYQLTIEDGTPFAALHQAGRLLVPENALADDLYQLTQEMTAAAGLPGYEISNHARPGEESRHNLLYWRYGEFAGIGPGAHGRLIFDDTRFGTSTERIPERWLARTKAQGHGLDEMEKLERREQADELLLMGLRIGDGVDLKRLARIGGVRPSQAKITELVELGVLQQNPKTQRLSATAQGRFTLNEIVLQLSSEFEPV